jgi:hypothetical protein
MTEHYRLPRKPRYLFSSFISAIIIVSLIAPFTSITAYALDIPQPIHPENFTHTTPFTDPPLAIPSFSWTAISGAKVYRLQVDNESGFNQPIFMDISTRNISYTPQSTGQLFDDGEWYWRVRVEDPLPAGDWSLIFHFTKTWATPENKPVLLAPDDGVAIPTFDYPIFSWEPVVGAARYRVQLASDNSFIDLKWSIDTLAISHQPNTRLANGYYYWRVVPMNAADKLGTPSETRQFFMAYGYGSMKPVLIEPQDLSHPTFTPTFRWGPVIGAELYRLEYTSDEQCDYGVGNAITTRQTSFTPTSTFANDKWYCWHVRIESGPAAGEWSDTWMFQKQWYLQPILLTPKNLREIPYPVYNWTPVPGAAHYRIEIATNPSFSPLYDSSVTANTIYSPHYGYFSGTTHFYWRVTPIDSSGSLGLTSAVWEFVRNNDLKVPVMVYPFYYYPPNDYGEYTVNPYEDRTVAFPIFIWHRVMNLPPSGGVFASAYRIQVDITPNFLAPLWVYDTKNTSATPLDDLFTPLAGQDYYWRVCVLDYMGGNCLTDLNAGWSQPWKARFNPSLTLPPTNGSSPELLRPAVGYESVEATPLFEWWPLQGATQYQVAVSREPNVLTPIFSEIVKFPVYSYPDILAQNSVGLANFGTYYWHVRGFINGAWGDWSEVWRFQVASQSDWHSSRTPGSVDNQLLIGEDPSDNVIAPTYELTTLYAAQSDGYWFLGFDANLTTPDMTYVFYLDLDHLEGSGATTSPADRPYTVTTIPAHQPEYAIYVDKFGGVINAQNTWVYAWDGTSWGDGERLSEILGTVTVVGGYIELILPNAAVGMSLVTGSASVMLFSVNRATNVLMDSVPSDPKVPEIPGNTPVLSRFSAISDHLNLVFPPNTATGDPTTFSSVLPFFWEWPTGNNSSTPYIGAVLEVHLDPQYTNRVAEYQISSNTTYFSENNLVPPNDIVGDNTYYWRIQPKYYENGYPLALGAWTGGWSFHRLGFTAKNLTTSTSFTTPTFRWDMAESAEAYQMQVATDTDFTHLVINIGTQMNSFTPLDTLAQGVYYWRVRISHGGVWNEWSASQQFTLTFLTPTDLTPDGEDLQYAPTFCWPPQLTAARYRVQVSTAADFKNIYDTIDTLNNCWTPTMGYNDGTYYWHVALIDGNGRIGDYSYIATFTKLYPITPLISPIAGAVPQTPTFIWNPINGAATYVFEISWFPNFFPLYDTVETINTQYTPTWTYTTERAYYWRVAMRDRDGRLGPFSYGSIIIGTVFPSFLPLVKR